MSEELREYEVVFAKGTPYYARYPITAASPSEAKREMSLQYIGCVDVLFMALLEVYEVPPYEGDATYFGQ